jgi:hypothetical protein
MYVHSLFSMRNDDVTVCMTLLFQEVVAETINILCQRK